MSYLSLPKALEKLEIFKQRGKVEEGIQLLLEKHKISRRQAKYELQNRLLRKTIAYAYANCPFYKGMFDKQGIRVEDIRTQEDLEKMPILNREDLRINMKDIINKNLTFSSIITTSGTSGKFLHLYLSYEEVMILSQLTKLFHGLKSEEAKQNLVLWIPSPFHGLPPILPSRTHCFMAPIFDKSLQTSVIHKLIADLTSEYILGNAVSRISAMAVFPPHLRDITRLLSEHDIDPKELGIKKIYTTGSHVSPTIREIAEKRWNAELFDNYSLAEVLVGNAAQCEEKRNYHFTVTVIPEVVDPDTKEKLKYGEEGLLVLTTLYPFQQTMPLIRYSTGDIVSLTDEVCKCGFEGVSIRKIVGRQTDCIDLAKMVDSKPRFLSPYDVYDIVETIAEIVYTKEASIHNTLPKFFVEKVDLEGNLTIIIHLELQKNVGKEREEQIKRYMDHQLRGEYLGLDKAIRNGDIKLEVKAYEYSTLHRHYIR